MNLHFQTISAIGLKLHSHMCKIQVGCHGLPIWSLNYTYKMAKDQSGQGPGVLMPEVIIVSIEVYAETITKYPYTKLPIF